MIIDRKEYVDRLAENRENGLVKIITGVRRCGKSFMLFKLFKDRLLQEKVPEKNMIFLALDNVENAPLRDPMALFEYLKEKTADKRRYYYIFLDEIQYVGVKILQKDPLVTVTFYDVLNGLMQQGNADIYVTGSNSKMLSKDVATQFRGRGDELHITPLSFAEYYRAAGGNKEEALASYMLYGGMPLVLSKERAEEKRAYLSGLFAETYFKDITERYKIKFPEAMAMITNELCSSVGSLTNAKKIADSLQSENGVDIDSETVAFYLNCLEDSFLFSRANRYDVKGKKYFSYPSKFYCTDTGLNNARLNFRQVEESHLMEDILYNEFVRRGESVDVGVVQFVDTDGGAAVRKTCEIDFVLNARNAGEKCYIQCALNIDAEEKKAQELRPFLKLKNDFTKRVMITKTMLPPWTDEYGIHHMGIYDFLLPRR